MISQRRGHAGGLPKTQTSKQSPQPAVDAPTALIAVTPGRDRPTRATDPAAMAPPPPPRSPHRQSLPRWPRRSAIAAARETPNPGTQGLTVGS
jgi:hypothetical protein